MISQTPRRHTARMDKGAGNVGHRIAIDPQQVGTCSRCETPSVGESEALLTIWEGKKKRALDHLREAAELAEEIGLPAEQWQIRVLLGNLYDAEGEVCAGRHGLSKGRGARSCGNWPKASRTRPSVRAFSPGHRCTRCCSTRTGVTP